MFQLCAEVAPNQLLETLICVIQPSGAEEMSVPPAPPSNGVEEMSVPTPPTCGPVMPCTSSRVLDVQMCSEFTALGHVQ